MVRSQALRARRGGFVLILLLLLIVVAAFGWHSLSMWFSADFHPVRLLAEVLALVLIYHLARRLIDQIGQGRPA
jgi:flagellar basal body-associated protein FliL